jgi:hypothetical protein
MFLDLTFRLPHISSLSSLPLGGILFSTQPHHLLEASSERDFLRLISAWMGSAETKAY